jgi:ATP-dependent exoDNAse (exonuclease V) beta subunit
LEVGTVSEETVSEEKKSEEKKEQKDPDPSDQEQRDRIRTDLGTTLFVDAGAGSGKTKMLIERYLAQICAGRSVRHMAAITFTEAAAADLRTRIRRELSEALECPDMSEHHDRFRQALDDLDGAAIQTLHAFAQRLLLTFPIEAGLPPTVEVADEFVSAIRFEHRWTAFLDDWFERPEWEATLRRFITLGHHEEHLAQIARQLDDSWDRLAPVPPDPADLPPVDASGVLDPLRKALGLRDRCRDSEDKLAIHLDTLVGPFVVDLEAAADDDRRIQLLQFGSQKLGCRKGRAPNWADAKPQICDALSRAQQAAADEVARQEAAVMAGVRAAIVGFVLGGAEARRRDGRLEFHDLLVLARNLLRDHPEARERIAAEFEVLFIDEFQDTDRLQIEIAHLIAAGANADPDRPWTEQPTSQGALFFVGDPKQSIYRFRRAEVERYVRAREVHGGGQCALTANFRTVAPIVDWVNRTCAELMAQPSDPDAPPQVDFAAQVPIRPPFDERPTVMLLGGELDERADLIRAHSAAELAARLRRMMDEGWPVQERNDDPPRPMAWDDVAVLIPGRIALPSLRAAFESAGIPYRIETSSLVWASQEVRDVLVVLGALADPGDARLVVAALRTPYFACSDDDLAAWRSAGGSWSYLAPTEAGDPVADALKELAELYRRRPELGVDGLVDELVWRRGGLVFAHLGGPQREGWRHLRLLSDQARAFVDSQRGDLGEFLEWAAWQSSEVIAAALPVLPEADEPAVRIMTIHGSKGLEFPVTAVFGLSTARNTRARARVVWGASTDSGEPELPEIRIDQEGKTDQFDQHVPAETQMDEDERARLLYVALTRARDRLIVCLHRPARRVTLASRLAGAVAKSTDTPVGSEPVSLEPPVDLSMPEPAGDEEVAEAARRREEFVAAHNALVSTRRSLVRSATSLAGEVAGDMPDVEGPPDAPDDGADEPTVGQTRTWRQGRAGTAFGRAVHGTLQLIDLAEPGDVDAVAASQAEAEQIAHVAGQVTATVRHALANPVLVEAASREHWKEMYVAAPMGEMLIEGYVDLLVDDGNGGYRVVDYKTDRVEGDGPTPDQVSKYRRQVAVYAWLVQQVTGRPVTGATLLFVSSRGAWAEEVDDLPSAIAEVMALG